MSDRKVALVLGGGGARGLAHIGVLKVLEDNHIPIDLIIGTSIGAFVGGFYAKGFRVEQMEQIAFTVDKKFVAKMFVPSFSTSGLVDSNRVRSYLEGFLGKEKIENLKIPFYSVATDLKTGEEVVFCNGPLVDSILGSIAVPALFMPFFYNGQHLVDGSLVNPLPVSVAHKFGADVIIAVDVSHSPSTNGKIVDDPKVSRFDKSFLAIKNRLPKQFQMLDVKIADKHTRLKDDERAMTEGYEDTSSPNVFQTLLQSIAIVETHLKNLHLSQWPVNVLIVPTKGKINFLDFHRAKDAVISGEAAATAALPDIYSAIEGHAKTH